MTARRSSRNTLRRTALSLASALIWLIAVASASTSAPPADAWHLDDTFGDRGEVTTDFGSSYDEVFGVAVQPDRKIVAAGIVNTSGPNGSDFGVARYLPHGTLDATFGNNGIVTTDFNGKDDGALGVALYPPGDPNAGKIVVAGYAGNPSKQGAPDVALARYLRNGNLDSSFGTGGKVRTTLDRLSAANALAIYPPGSGLDDRIVVAGYVSSQTGDDFLVLRYFTNGAKDLAFGASFHVGNSQNEQATAVALQSDGKVVLAGPSDTTSDGAYVVRLGLDSDFDPTFGDQGVHVEGASDLAQAWGLAIRPNGRILVGGAREDSKGVFTMAVAQLTPAGADDNSWGNNHMGFATFVSSDGKTEWPSLARATLLQPDGKVVLVGYAAQTGDGTSLSDLVSFAAARFESNGLPDDSFGNNAVSGGNGILAGFGFGYDAALAGALQPDGDIVAAGGSNQTTPPAENIDFATARFTGAGAQGPAGFRAHVLDLKPFQLVIKPNTFRVQWAVDNPPGPAKDVTFDVRTTSVRWSGNAFAPWDIILTKTSRTETFLGLIPGTTICIETRAHSKGFTTPWSKEVCTATPVDDHTLGTSGKWNRLTASTYYDGTASGTGQQGASLFLDRVTAKRFVLVAPECNGCGTVQILIDGTAVKTISLQAPSDTVKVLIPITVLPKPGKHDVEIKAVKIGSRGVYIDALGASP